MSAESENALFHTIGDLMLYVKFYKVLLAIKL